MTAKRTKSACTILACSIIALLACGCDLTLGPVTKTKTIIIKAGTGIEILQNVTVRGRVITENADGSYDEITQDIGGWIAMHPDHWASVKRTIESLRAEVKRLEKK